MTTFGVDAGSPSLREADHLIHELVDRLGLPAGTVACTHLIRTGRPHVAISFDVPGGSWRDAVAEFAVERSAGAALDDRRTGPDDLASAAAVAAAEHASRTGGRAVVYPGVDGLTGTVAVADVLSSSAVGRLVMLGGQAGEATGHDLLVTRDHVRPEWRDGVLTLATMPTGAGSVTPFEVPDPTPCCVDHA
ncbi:MAG TPA: hypothetical protein VGP03_06060 [Pseudonocardiaceae bacterium]|jgi:hypothetical protein|nr:hypothetical protein [Pseudonocardiaceae bacterium]